MSLSKDIIREMTQAHYQLQVGCYLEKTVDLGGAVFSLGKYITDCYWNYASSVSTSADETQSLIDKVLKFAVDSDRQPAFYLDPSTEPPDFPNRIQQEGFSLEDQEMWMLFENSDFGTDIDKSKYAISVVKTELEMAEFCRVFDAGFGMSSTSYSASLMDAFKSPPSQVDITHYYISSSEGKMCSVATLYSSGEYGGIYNVTTLPEFRKKGMGTALNLRAINDSKEKGHRLLILQTEENGDAYRIYSRLGFKPGFVANIYTK